MSAPFLPSQVVLGYGLPLVGTMGKSEAEWAAAMIIRALQVRGDTWRPISAKEVIEVFEADVQAGAEPWAKLARNPFWKPSPQELVRRGFATRSEGGELAMLEITPAGLVAIEKWVQR